MTDQPEQLASLIADINQVLARLQGRKPLFASPDWERHKQILERTRAYLLERQAVSQGSMTQEGGSGASSPGDSLPPDDWQRLPSQILQSLRSDLEQLQQQREGLLAEIRSLESLRSQQRSLAQQHQVQQQIISEFLQGLTGRLQDNINQQIAQTLGRLETELLAQEQIRTSPTSPQNAPALPLRPTQRLEQLQMLQARSDQLLITLDATLRSVFEMLQRNIQSYEESLSLGLSKMHNLGQQGEVLFTALVKQLTEQLAQEISQQLVNPSSAGSGSEVLPLTSPPPRPTTSLPLPEQVSYIPNEEDATIIQNFPYAGAEVIPRMVRQAAPPARSIEQDLSDLDPELETALNLDLEFGDLPEEPDLDDGLATILQTEPANLPSPTQNAEIDLFYETLFGDRQEALNSPAENASDPAIDSLEQALFSGLADPAESPKTPPERAAAPSQDVSQELFAEAWQEEVQRGEQLVRNLPPQGASQKRQEPAPGTVTIAALTDLQFEDRIISPVSEPSLDLALEDLALENLEADLLEPLPPEGNEDAENATAEDDSYIPAPPEENLLPLELSDQDASEDSLRDRLDVGAENRRDLTLDPVVLQQLSEDLGRFEQEQFSSTPNPVSGRVSENVQTPDNSNLVREDSEDEALEFTSTEFIPEELASELELELALASNSEELAPAESPLDGNLQDLQENSDRLDEPEESSEHPSVEPDLVISALGEDEYLASDGESLEESLEFASTEFVPEELAPELELELALASNSEELAPAESLLDENLQDLQENSDRFDESFDGILAAGVEETPETAEEVLEALTAEVDESAAIILQHEEPEPLNVSIPETPLEPLISQSDSLGFSQNSASSEPEIITNSLLEIALDNSLENDFSPETNPTTGASSQEAENGVNSEFSSELFADSEVVEDFSWSELESQGQVAQEALESASYPDWADVAADPTAPDIFATFMAPEAESAPLESGINHQFDTEENSSHFQTESTSFGMNLTSDAPENKVELTVQPEDLKVEEELGLAALEPDLESDFIAETAFNDAENSTIIQAEPESFESDLNLDDAENRVELTVSPEDLKVEEEFGIEEEFDLAALGAELEPDFGIDNSLNEVEENITVIQTNLTSVTDNSITEAVLEETTENWPELTVQETELTAEEEFDLAALGEELEPDFGIETSLNEVDENIAIIQTDSESFEDNSIAETALEETAESWPELTVQGTELTAEEESDLIDLGADLDTDLDANLGADLDADLDTDLDADFTGKTVDAEDLTHVQVPQTPSQTPPSATEIPEEDLVDLWSELETPIESTEVEIDPVANLAEDDLADLAAQLAAEDPAFQDYIENQETEEIVDWSAQLAAEDATIQENGVVGGHALSPKDLVIPPEPPIAEPEKKTNPSRPKSPPKQVFKSLLNNAQERARQQAKQQNISQTTSQNTSHGSISQTADPTPPPMSSLQISGVWYLGLDFGTTGISAVLLNQVTGEHFPIYWHTEAQSIEGGASFRLPAIAYTGLVAALETPEPSADRTHQNLVQNLVHSAFAPPLREPQAGERLQNLKPYLNVTLPYYSPEQKAWQPILQGENHQSVALHWYQRAAQALLSTLTGAAPESDRPFIGAVGLSATTLRAALRQLNGVIVGIPAVGGEAFRFNLREAILGSQLVTQPDMVFFLEDPIATVLGGLTGNALPGVSWRGGTLVINGGARSIELALVDLPENLAELSRGHFACRSFEYGGDGIDQDILLQLLAPRLSGEQLSLPTPEADLPPVGAPSPSLRNRWQMVFQQSELGQTLQNEARGIKQALQQQEQATVTVGDQNWEITRHELEQRVLHPLMENLNREVNALLVETGMNGAEIRTCVCTGGTTALRVIGKWLRQKLPNAVVIRDTAYATSRSSGEAAGISCTPIAYGLASLPLYPTVLDRLHHQYSDYFLLMEVLRAFPDAPLTRAEITQRLELRGIYTRSCQGRLQALLTGELPQGLVPSEADLHLLEPASAENPDYQRIGQAPLFTKVSSQTYQLNRTQASVMMRYLQTILKGTVQKLNEPLAIQGSLLTLSIQSSSSS